MKMLWIPQLSVDVGGKWNLSADSNWRVASDTIQGFRDLNIKMEINIVVPLEENILDIKALEEVPADYFLHHPFPQHPFEYRFSFDSEAWKKLLFETDYDVVFLNEPCLVMNVRSLYIAAGKRVPILVAFNHWVDNFLSPKTPEGMTYFYRQVEGAMYADIYYVNSEYSKEFFIMGAQRYFKDIAIEELKKKVHAFNVPVNTFELKEVNIKKNNTLTVAYNQRLSSLPYYRDSFTRFIKVVRELQAEGLEFDVWIFNPASKDVSKLLEGVSGVKMIKAIPRKEYYAELAKCHITADFYDSERVWSISHNEACFLNCMPILKNAWGYREMYPTIYGGYYKTFGDGKDKLRKAIKDKKWREEQIKCARKYMIEFYSSKVIAKEVYDRIKKVRRK